MLLEELTYLDLGELGFENIDIGKFDTDTGYDGLYLTYKYQNAEPAVFITYEFPPSEVINTIVEFKEEKLKGVKTQDDLKTLLKLIYE